MGLPFELNAPTDQNLLEVLGIGNTKSKINLGTPTLPMSPYLRIVIAGKPNWKLDREGLHAYMQGIASGADSREKSLEEWQAFAKEHNLMAGNHPLTVPDKCFIGPKRWITSRWHGDWEVHIHFGFVNNPNEKHSHISLAQDSKGWLPKIASKCKHMFLFKPHVTGEATIISYDTGLKVTPRQPFSSTLKSKETLAALGALVLSGGSWFLRNMNLDDFNSLAMNAVIGLAVALGITFLYAVFKHLFALPRYSWSIPELKD